MRIQQKFGLLYAVLGVTAAVNLAVATWSIRFLARELSWPLQSMQEVMLGLHKFKRGVEDQGHAIGYRRGAGATAPDSSGLIDDAGARSEFEAALARTEAALADLEKSPSYPLRSGVSTTRNVRERLSAVSKLAAQFWGERDAAGREELASVLGSLHELIERLEGRILADAGMAANHEERLRGLVTALLLFSALGILLAGVLGMILVRRLVIRPVAQLQAAALRIGSGDLSHRLEVRGSDEMAELATEMNNMAATLLRFQEERVERERLAAVGEMTRRIVHNLRKPLSGIRALAETTRDELPSDSDLVPVQERIVRAVDRFEEWLRDVLKASSPLELSLVETEVAPWIAGVLDAHRPEAETKGVRLVLDLQDAVARARFDPAHLGHALSAVITNAIEFSPSGGSIAIGFQSENGRWRVRVRDSGPGVPAEHMESVFRPYMTTRRAGTGIGLAIAKRVAEQHGGTIRVVPPAERPQEPAGAVFEFDLPLQ